MVAKMADLARSGEKGGLGGCLVAKRRVLEVRFEGPNWPKQAVLGGVPEMAKSGQNAYINHSGRQIPRKCPAMVWTINRDPLVHSSRSSPFFGEKPSFSSWSQKGGPN